MAPQLITAVTAFLSLPLFVRFLGNDNYAIWNYALLYAGLFGFADAGLGVAVGRFVGIALGQNDREAVRGYWGTGNVILIPFLVAAAIILVITGFYFAPRWYNVPPDRVNLLRACIAATGGGILFNYYSQYWNILAQAHLDFKFIGKVQMITNLLKVIPALVLAGLTQNPFMVTAWYALVALLELIIFVRHGWKIYHLGMEFSAASRSRFREMSGYFSKNLIGLVAGSFLGQIDRQVLGKFAPSSDFTHYTMAGNLSLRLQGLSNAVMGPVFFNTARVADDQRRISAALIYDEMFNFVFSWYLLATTWVVVWHPVFVHLWLVHTMGVAKGTTAAAQVGPLLVPLVAACGFTAITNVSVAQLGSLNRIGTSVLFTMAAGLVTAAGVWLGWRWHSILGAAYGFLFSRLVFIAQDLFTIHIIKAKGWLGTRVWKQVAFQGLAALLFAGISLLLPGDSPWLLVPALLHGSLVAGWLLRRQVFNAFGLVSTP